MKTFTCVCNATLFFENSLCLRCHRDLGWCPACEHLTALLPADGETYTCGRSACGASLVKCENYVEHNVCNRCRLAGDGPGLCDACRFNQTIPDLSVEGNKEKWFKLEQAKRRLLYELDGLRLPYGEDVKLPLAFDFKADTIPDDARWNDAEAEGEKVYTGHADGLITINLAEADPAEREANRVKFGERHRTLIGHFRHEVGHYFWQLLVQDDPAEVGRFKDVFGDHEDPTYAEAMDAYYADGPDPDWQAKSVSAYATMHPWEDFAETWAAYLDMAGVLDTAAEAGFGVHRVGPSAGADELTADYARVGVFMTEMNRVMGLLDFVPQTFGPGVGPKLDYVHGLVNRQRQS